MKYCPDCGKLLKEGTVDNHLVKQCDCGFIDWDNWVNVCVMTICFNDKNEFMMVTLKGKEDGKMTFPGGFREMNETIEEAAKRETQEESGYLIDHLSLFRVFNNDVRRLVWIVFLAKIVCGDFCENCETKDARFYSKTNPPKMENMRGLITSELVQQLLDDRITPDCVIK
jgi:ADP-ribose pyrophosphatase YjhB (NUDIX family)